MARVAQLARRASQATRSAGPAVVYAAVVFTLVVAFTADASEHLNVFVSIPPQAFFAHRIAGPLADVHVLVGPGQSPHTFEPTQKQLTALAGADVYFAIGLPFEERIVEKLSEMDMHPPVVNTSEHVRRIPMSGAAHDHEGSGETERQPDHGAHGQGMADDGAPHDGLMDPHTWLDPSRAAIQARSMCEKLCELAPQDADVLRDSLTALEADLDALNREVGNILAPLRGRRIYVFHPALGYLTSAYGLIQVPVESSGTEPGPRALAALIDRASEEQVRAIFVQPQNSNRAAEALADEIGAKVVTLDPLAEDYINNMRSMARTLVESSGR